MQSAITATDGWDAVNSCNSIVEFVMVKYVKISIDYATILKSRLR